MLHSARVKTWFRRSIVATTILGLILLGLVAALHTAPARDVVLRRAVRFVADRFELAIAADSLHYNLFTGRVSLSNVALAAAHSTHDPFLTADEIEATLSSAALFGGPIDRIRVENARFGLHRRADGSSNLPSGQSSGDAPPSAVRIGRTLISRLAVTITDEGSGVSLSLPNLTVDVGPETGHLRLIDAGRVARRDSSETLTAFGGGLAFDGRAIHLTRFTATTDVADVTLDGQLALLVRDPRVDLRASATGRLSALAKWTTVESVPDGTVALEAAINGPLSSPTMSSRVRSDSLSYRGAMLSGLDADVVLDRDRMEATRVEMSMAGGRVKAVGTLSFDAGDVRATASWSDVSVEQLVHMLAGPRSPVPAGRATGAGSFSGTPSDVASWALEVSNRLVAARASSPSLVAIAGEGTLRVDEGRWQLGGTHVVAGAAVHTALHGRVDATDIGASTIAGTVDARNTDLSRVLTSLEAMDLIETVPTGVAGELDVSASLSGAIAKPAIQVSASGRGLSAFDLSDVTIDATATGDVQRAVVDARVRQGSANALEIGGTVWPREGRLDATVTGTLEDMSTLARGVPVAGVADVRIDARGPFRALMAAGSISVTDARYRDAALGPLDGQIAFEDGVARFDLSARDFGALAVGSVRLEGSRASVVDLRVENARVDRVLQAASVEADISGTFSLTAHAEGDLDDWRHAAASLDIGAFDGQADQLAIHLHQPARVRYDRGTLDVISLEAALGATGLSINGRYDLLGDATPVAPGNAIRGVLVGDLSHVVDAVRSSGLVDRVDLVGSGPVVVLARVGGAGERPVLSADIELGPADIASMDLPPVRDVRVRSRIADGWAEVVSASGDWQGARIAIEGRAPLRLLGARLPQGLVASSNAASGPASVDVRAVSVTSQALSAFLPPESIAQIEGALDATVHLEASALEWESLQGEARLDRLDLTVAGLALAQQEPTRIEIENGIARLANWNWTGRGTSLIVQGEVRLPERRAAVLAGGRMDLRLLTPFLAGADMAIGGALTPRVSVAGPFDDLRIEGDLSVTGGEIRLRTPGVIVTDLSMAASLGRERARITSLDGQINGGTVTGTGDVTYSDRQALAGSIDTTITGMGLEFPEGLRSELNAQLNLALVSEGDDLGGTLSGAVTVVRSAYREPIAVINRVLGAVRTERLAAAAAGERTFADRLRLNVRVLTDSDVIVDNNLARLQLGGDVRVIGTAAAPALSGRATLREGGELFLGRNRYRIDSGSIDFANPATIEPNLNVQAQTRAGGEDIELTLKGTPETMSVDLRSISDPQLGQADIASLLLTGRQLHEVSGAEAQIVGEQVLGYLSGDVLGAAGRVVGLDTIRLGGVDPTLRRRDSADIASEADPTSRLTFGKSLGDSLDVTLSQSLRDGGAQTWILDYAPAPPVDLRFVNDDDNLRTYAFRHDVTIGDPGRRSRVTRPERVEQRVTGVTLAGELGGPEARLRRVIDMEAGDVFDFSTWQGDRDRLERALHGERRLEARVSTRREDTADGVAITYQIEAGPLTSVRVTGYSATRDTIRTIETAWTRAIFDDALVDEVEGLVRRTLQDRGYLEPSVTATVTTNGEKRLDVLVDPGDRAVDRRLVVDASDETLGRGLEQWASREGTEELAWRNPAAFQRALVEELRRRGHAAPDVVVGPARVERGAGVVRIDVRAGPISTVGDVRVVGTTHVPDRLRDAAGLERGAPYDPGAVERARERVVRVMRGEGFADVRVDAKAESDGRLVTVVFAIDEGPRQVLRDVVVSGSRTIDREVIDRAIGLEVGAQLGVDAWLTARSRLFDTALFRRVDVTAEPIGAAAAGERPMRLLVTVEEWPPLRVRYGLQVSEERPVADVEGREITPGLSADVTRRTLFGRAITVGGAAEYQRHERRARGFLNTPTFFGRPVESIFTVERSREELPEASVITDRGGVSWEQRLQIGRPLRLSYGYQYDRDHTFSTRPSDDPLNPPFDATVDVARLTGSSVYDTRNSPLDTTRGWMASSTFEFAPASLGSDIRFVRYLGQVTHFMPRGRVVLASAARIGLATALDGQGLIPSERFYAGGARTVRGVPENALGPRDIFGDAAGGGALVVFNQEVRVPIYRWFNGVGFVDVGNVFERPSVMDFGDLVGSFGAGLRIATPFAVLRADVARLWSPEVGQPAARWTFGIGHTF